jgi:hypothetical protein
MASTKSRPAIEADQVPDIFTDPCIEHLARIGKFPLDGNKRVLAEGMRDAARTYARKSREPNDNEMRLEIESLCGAAERRDYDQVAMLIESLSCTTRNLLLNYAYWQHDETATTLASPKPNGPRRRRPISAQWTNVPLPRPETLRDEASRDKACATVVKLCQCGGTRGARGWRWYLRAPKPQRNFPKRDVERGFVTLLTIAWTEATGEMPSPTADPGCPGPYARMVKECLRLVGAGHADAVGLLNSLHECRRKMKARPARTLV